ncbi:MORN repeat-containing protein, putative [Eimeria brunetti]|uniref:MORN repeat-containing protein, putative n=1 Tax=Eimeria brunetti TaxID=51314 RepID=U6LPL8_9EIME|nr:MORN repeat-containing protein, putative [Eimeria brunetti]
MHPADSVFAIGGEDESEAEEDLLAEGARRLGALAAGVSPTVGASPGSDGATNAGAVKTASPVATSPPDMTAGHAASPASEVPRSPQGETRFLESHSCALGSSGGGRPGQCSTGAVQEQQCATERGSIGSTNKTSAAHRSSVLDENISVYRPEVDGPPIVGYGISLVSPFSMRFRMGAGMNNRSLWRGHSDGKGCGAFSWSGEAGEATLLQWVEKFALPELIPARSHPQAVHPGSVSSDWEGDPAADQRHSSHIFFTVPVAKSNSYVFGVSCYSVQSERLWDPSAPEDAQGMCAVCLVARVPFWGLLLFRLLPVTAAFFDLMEGAAPGSPGRLSSSGLPTQVLVQLYDQLNTVNFHLMRYTEITFNLEVGLPPFIMAVAPRQLLVLVKALLLERKILFYSCDASRASTAVLSFISLLPAGLACGFSSDGFGEHEYRWKRHGLPFRVFESRSAFFPILPLELVDDLLLQKRAFLISSNNPTLLTHPVAKPDIVGKLDVDAKTVEVKNTSLEPLLRLTGWEQQFARHIVMETSFSSGVAEGHSPGYGCSTSISRHATDLLQQTISSLASHAAAHFLKPKDDGATSELHGFHSSGEDSWAADAQPHRRRAASVMSPRDNRRRSNSSSSLGRGKQTAHEGGARHRTQEDRKRNDDNSTLVCQSSAASQGRRLPMREGDTALASSSWTPTQRSICVGSVFANCTSDGALASAYPSPRGGGWLSGRIRWGWERQAEQYMHTSAAAPTGMKSRKRSSAGMHGEAVSLSFTVGAAVLSVEWISGRWALPGTTRPQAESRSSSDATGPSAVLGPNWETQADLIRAAFAQHLEQLCRKAAIAAGRERSRQLLLQQLSSAASEDGDNLSAFGVDWVRGWSETHNFQAWLLEHRLPNEGAPSAKHETMQPPPTCGYAKYLYSNGDCYEGQFWASQRHGDGVYCSADGMRYDGSWVSDERHGHGVLAHESVGYLYVGQWQHNKKSGEGHLYSRKERYWGQFFDNKYHGRGRYVQRDGLDYEGEFARGRFEGLGKLSISRDEGKQTLGECRKGVVIRGTFEGGKVTGVVNAVYADGRTYTGELTSETLLPEGSGSMLYRDSCLYDGQWRSGLRHGAGVLTIPVGVVKGTHVSKEWAEEGTITVDGQWADDMPDPDAEWSVTFPTGDKYLGNLKFPSIGSNTGGDADKIVYVGRTDVLAKIVPHGWGLSKRKDTGEVSALPVVAQDTQVNGGLGIRTEKAVILTLLQVARLRAHFTTESSWEKTVQGL